MDEVAKNAMKISIVCLFVTILIAMILGYIMLTQVSAMASMSRDIQTIKEKLEK